jgi:serine/threonine-protein kinase HipA
MLAIEGEGRVPTRAHVLRLGQRHGISLTSIDAIIDRARAAVADWPVHAADAGVGPSLRLVAARLATVDRDFMAA